VFWYVLGIWSDDLEKPGRMPGGHDGALFFRIFPRGTEQQDKTFKLLKKAYIDARYKKDYKITRVELEYLAKRVRKLLRLTNKICKERNESFGNP